MRHQRRALAWMLKRETRTPCGGILADDQGLVCAHPTLCIQPTLANPTLCQLLCHVSATRPKQLQISVDSAGVARSRSAQGTHTVNVALRVAQGKTLTALALVASSPGPAEALRDAHDAAQHCRDKTPEASTSDAAQPLGGTLIVCPKSTLRATWLAEIRRRMVGSSAPCCGLPGSAILTERCPACDGS
jgi:hypothetical protein